MVKYITTFTCGVDSTYGLKLYRIQNQAYPNIWNWSVHFGLVEW